VETYYDGQYSQDAAVNARVRGKRVFCKKTVCCVMNVKSRLVQRYKVETDERDQSLYTARQRGQ